MKSNYVGMSASDLLVAIDRHGPSNSDEMLFKEILDEAESISAAQKEIDSSVSKLWGLMFRWMEGRMAD